MRSVCLRTQMLKAPPYDYWFKLNSHTKKPRVTTFPRLCTKFEAFTPLHLRIINRMPRMRKSEPWMTFFEVLENPKSYVIVVFT